MTDLYNRVRQYNKGQYKDQNNDNLIFGVALNEIINYIRERYEYSDTLPVFKLADLVKLVIKHMTGLGAQNPTSQVHATRLKILLHS